MGVTVKRSALGTHAQKHAKRRQGIDCPEGVAALNMARVRVRRDRPTALAVAVALCVTMLVVYVLTLNLKGPDVVESMAAAPRVTRQIEFMPLEGWGVVMARCESEQEARLQASAWVGRGAAGCVVQWDGKWVVLGAVYASEKDARRIAGRLSEDEGLAAGTLRMRAEGLTLRITAPQAQIDAIAAADALLRKQADQLGSVALQLDRGEIGPDAARTLCALAATEGGDAAKAVGGIPGAADNALCLGLYQRLLSLSEMHKTVAGSARASGASLSGMLRCAQVETFVGHWALLNGLKA